MMTVFRLVLLVGLVLCAIATALVKKPMQAVIIYMAYSVMMSVVWILLQSPDLAITEAAVGAGITSILFFLTLRRINLIDKDAEQSGEQRKEEPMIRHRQTKSNNELQSEFRRHLRFWLAGELDLTEQMRTPPAPEEQPPARYRPQRSEEAARRGIIHSQKLYRLLAGALCIVFAGLMMMTVANLPPFGAEDSPTVNDVAGRYVGRGTEETGAVNTVAGMILDYRAFDTLGESFVLFTAVCTVTILLHQPAHKTRLRRVQPDRCRYDRDPIVRKMAAFVIPVILVFGVYVLLNGHLSPGGGFSGGAILAAAFILYALVWGDERASQLMTPRLIRTVVVCSLGFYCLAKSYSFYTGANHLHSVISPGTPGRIFSAGLILPLNVAVGLVVCCTMYSFYMYFRRGEL